MSNRADPLRNQRKVEIVAGPATTLFALVYFLLMWAYIGFDWGIVLVCLAIGIQGWAYGRGSARRNDWVSWVLVILIFALFAAAGLTMTNTD